MNPLQLSLSKIFPIIVALYAISPFHAYAAISTWTGGSGVFSNGANWIGGVPSSSDTANFTQTGTITVSYSADATVDLLRLNATSGVSNPATLILDMNGHTFTALGTTGNSYESSTNATIGPKTLTLQDGTLALKAFDLGITSSATPNIMRIQNGAIVDASSLVTSSATKSYIGHLGAGQLYVEAGGMLRTAATVEIGYSGANATGLVEVNGSGAVWNATGNASTGTSPAVIVGDGANGTLNIFNGGSVTTNNIYTAVFAGVSSVISVSGTGSSLSASALYIGGNSGAAGGTATATVSSGGTIATTGPVTVWAPGTLTLNGGTINNTGLLNINSGLVSGNGIISGLVKFNAVGATLNGNGGTLTLNSGLNVTSSGSITGGTVSVAGTTAISSGQTLTVNGTLGGAGALTFGAVSSALAGTGAVNKAITLTGQTLSSSGTLTLGSGLTVNTGGGTISSGTLASNGTTSISNGVTLTVNGTLGGTGDLTLSGGTNIDGTGTINKSGGTISGSGTVGGSVTTTLSNGAITGGTFANAVTASNSAVSGGAYNGALTLNNGSSITGLTLGNGLTIGGTGATINSGTTTANGTITVNDGAALTINGTLGGSGILNFQSMNAAGIAGTGTVSKAVSLNGNKTLSSNGTLTLGSTLGVTGTGNAVSSGTVSVSGTTTISSGGALAVNGTLSGAGSMSVDGILSGSGIINKAVTVGSGGTLAPGNSPGNLSISNLTLMAGGNYNWQIYDAKANAGVGYDTITVSGTLDLTGLSTGSKYAINLWSLSSVGPDVNGSAINFNPNLTQSWTLVEAGAVDLTGLNIPISDYFQVFTTANNGTNGFANTVNGTFSVRVNGTDLMLDYIAVPEPSTYVLMGLGLAVVLYRSRRRMKK